MKDNKLFLDTETFSELSLPDVGVYRYAKECRIDLFSWALGPDMPIKLWDCTEEKMPNQLYDSLADERIIKVAQNSNFDRNVIKENIIEIPIEQWEDTMVIAYSLAMPGNLDQILTTLGADIDFQKISDGKRLVRMFCKPQNTTKNQPFRIRDSLTDPEEWGNYKVYCVQDTNSMRWAYYKMPQWVIGNGGRPIAQQELDLWHLSEHINDRGLPIDRELAQAAIKLTDIELDRLNAEVYELTDGAVDAHSKRDQMLAWITEQGVVMKGYTKENLIDVLKLKIPQKVRRALEIRQEAGRTSTAKYQTLLDSANDDDRLRGGIQYYGAKRTGRYAGRRFQPHNLSHPEVSDTDNAAEAIINGTTDLLYSEPAMAIAVSCVRSTIKAPEGKLLAVSDLSNIEGRVLPWLAGEAWKLQAFIDYDNGVGPDIYKLAYHKAFGTPFEDIGKDQRQIGKFQELSLGYQGGVGAFYKQAKKFGTNMEDIYSQVIDKADDRILDSALWMVDWIRENRKDLNEISDNGIIGADIVKQLWRISNEEIVRYWYKLEDMVRRAIESAETGSSFRAGLIQAAVREEKLLIVLPSKRPLVYRQPYLKADGSMRYMNFDKGSWKPTSLYAGKIAENVVQAVARDVLTHNMKAIDKRYPILGTVHDEVICEIFESEFSSRNSDEVQYDLDSMMSVNPPWATGLPLSAGGYISKRYKKD